MQYISLNDNSDVNDFFLHLSVYTFSMHKKHNTRKSYVVSH